LDWIDAEDLGRERGLGQRWKKEEGRGPPVGIEAQARHQLLIGLDRVGAGWLNPIDAAQGKRPREGDRAAGRAIRHDLSSSVLRISPGRTSGLRLVRPVDFRLG